LQPMQFAGRTDGVTPKNERLTLTEVRQNILAQTKLFEPADIVPVPCNPDSLSMAYALKSPLGIAPLTRYVGTEALLAGPRNTIVFESDPALKAEVFKLFSTNLSPEAQANCLSSLMCCLPNIDAPANITYDNVFRVLIMAFMDAANFDVRQMKKSCVHIVQEDGRIIPFESFNLLYRDDRKDILAKRRAEQDMLFGKTDASAKVIPIVAFGR
jgi:7,8-dihydro-6-hydroxymethylpterin dimethyltransferase